MLDTELDRMLEHAAARPSAPLDLPAVLDRATNLRSTRRILRIASAIAIVLVVATTGAVVLTRDDDGLVVATRPTERVPTSVPSAGKVIMHGTTSGVPWTLEAKDADGRCVTFRRGSIAGGACAPAGHDELWFGRSADHTGNAWVWGTAPRGTATVRVEFGGGATEVGVKDAPRFSRAYFVAAVPFDAFIDRVTAFDARGEILRSASPGVPPEGSEQEPASERERRELDAIARQIQEQLEATRSDHERP